MEREVNTKAMNQLAKTQERYDDLIKKKDIVYADKEKILNTIQTLDQMKKEAVTKAYHEVNRNFTSVFETLLPGATAELRPQKGKSVLDGLEFRVGFNGTWKDNLSELSGGQRSLVALSLILGLLMLKPAPLYILDEIDSALDASHTANIGRMLAKHFQKSQFIVVSLKDGMFNNANVLYRTQFTNGVSSVTRHGKGERGGPNSNNLVLGQKHGQKGKSRSKNKEKEAEVEEQLNDSVEGMDLDESAPLSKSKGAGTKRSRKKRAKV